MKSAEKAHKEKKAIV